MDKPDRQKQALDLVKSTGNVNEALRIADIPKGTWDRWRADETKFRHAADEALRIGKAAKQHGKTRPEDIYDPDRPIPPLPSIREFRWDFIGRPTPAHQEPVVDAWEDLTNHTVLVLMPTGGGKDTLAGDIVLRDTLDRTTRASWIMESADQSEKRLARLERYYWDARAYDIQPDGPGTQLPTRNIPEVFGHYKWTPDLRYPNGDKVESPRWTRNQLYFLGRNLEADPNLWATGVGAAIYGSRMDEAILSDISTVENQASPSEREKQWAWTNGTLLTRLDESGRLLGLMTRVAEYDNAGRMLDEFTTDAEILIQTPFYTKYDNGVAVVTIQGIQVGPDGEEKSFWPEVFPLDASLKKDGDIVSLDGLSKDRYRELAARGYKRDRGLREFRKRAPGLFASMIQQQPSSAQQTGNFTPEVLALCDDPTRTYGQRTPGALLILGIDPATAAGAAWVLWELSGGVFHVVDYFYGENIGTIGLREKLLVEPITRFSPRFAMYEDNREASVLEHPQVIAAARNSGTQLKAHHTHSGNRGESQLGVAGMVMDMVEGRIKWPTATPADKDKTEKLKNHFRNWDSREILRQTTGKIRQHMPDDIAMASWVGWLQGKRLAPKARSVASLPKVSERTRRIWGQSGATKPAPDPLDFPGQIAAYYEGTNGSA